jgi:hypothetical protein
VGWPTLFPTALGLTKRRLESPGQPTVAGEHFTADDPYFSCLPARERKYTPSGRVTGPYTFPETKWRFVKSAEGKLGPWGKFLRVWNVGSSRETVAMALMLLVRQTPAAVVGRHPGHWGFYMVCFPARLTLQQANPTPKSNPAGICQRRSRSRAPASIHSWTTITSPSRRPRSDTKSSAITEVSPQPSSFVSFIRS